MQNKEYDYVYCPHCEKRFQLDDEKGVIRGSHAKGCPRKYQPKNKRKGDTGK